MIATARRLTAAVQQAGHTLSQRSAAQPFATNLSLLSVPVGALAVLFGPGVSRAFVIVYHRPELIYIWGAVLLFGGANVAAGILRRVPSVERAGLYVLCLPWAFYGVSVIIGLGRAGLVAGPLAVTVALSCLQRGRFILTEARRLIVDAEDAEEWAVGQLASHEDD